MFKKRRLSYFNLVLDTFGLFVHNMNMFRDLKRLSDWARAEFGLPPSKEPFPDLMELKEPDTKATGDVLWKPPVKEIDDYLTLAGIRSAVATLSTVPAWTS